MQHFVEIVMESIENNCWHVSGFSIQTTNIHALDEN